MPSIELVRLVSSGTEATMSALRLARGCTGRAKIVKFEGCYHGHGDSLLVKAGSGALTFGQPSSAGVPAAIAGETLVAPYNDIDAVDALFAANPGAIACVIVEPVAGNMDLVAPRPGFLEGLRALCDAHGALLIFDEVMTGFRVHPGGAQALYGITPDLTTLGKVIGGGMPVGAFGGRRALMEQIAPLGPVYQAGTLSGNPVAVAAGLATLVGGTPGPRVEHAAGLQLADDRPHPLPDRLREPAGRRVLVRPAPVLLRAHLAGQLDVHRAGAGAAADRAGPPQHDCRDHQHDRQEHQRSERSTGRPAGQPVEEPADPIDHRVERPNDRARLVLVVDALGQLPLGGPPGLVPADRCGGRQPCCDAGDGHGAAAAPAVARRAVRSCRRSTKSSPSARIRRSM